MLHTSDHCHDRGEHFSPLDYKIHTHYTNPPRRPELHAQPPQSKCAYGRHIVVRGFD